MSGVGGKKKGRYAAKSMALNNKDMLITKDDYNQGGQTTVTYGRVDRLLGGTRFGVFCLSKNKELQCIIPGKMKGRSATRIEVGHIVLVDVNDADKFNQILLRYTSSESYKLKNIHEEVGTLLNGSKNPNGTDRAIDDEDDVVEFSMEEDFNDL